MIKKNSFIVSCQALKGEPLYGKGIVLKMANAVIGAKAEGLRISQFQNIKDIMNAKFNVPVIGLIKKQYNNSEIYITPTLRELKSLVALKVNVIAIDATTRVRPNQNLKFLVNWFNKNKAPNQKLMADCSNKEDVMQAIDLNFDYISTTLRGYTSETKDNNNSENDFEFVKWAIQICKKHKIPLIAEGGVNTPECAKKVLELGAYSVVVGSAITRPQFITETFYKKIKNL